MKRQAYTLTPGKKIALADFDPGESGGYSGPLEVVQRLHKLRRELAELQGLLYADNRFAVLVILQGIDASGKDGTIRHVMSGLTPLGCGVTAFKVPSEEELEHDFLWRIHKAVPRRGEIGIFNRSHYEDVLVARVHRLVPHKVWKARYRQINDFEHILTQNQTVLVKFFLHLSKVEQRRRFEERLANPKKYWKFSQSDVDERRHWDEYQEAFEDMLNHCTTEWAPWTVVPADRKWYRNLVVAETLVQRMKKLDMRYPPATFDRSKIVIDP